MAESGRVLGAELPDGARFVGVPSGEAPLWSVRVTAPDVVDLDTCVACGLCLPYCPTYRLTGEEPASPRGRIAAMRAVQAGTAEPDARFAEFMDLCLVCRACEDVCPSDVPFGRMMESAREQIEPGRPMRSRLIRWLGFRWVLPHPSAIRALAAFQPLIRMLAPRRVRKLVPGSAHPFARLPRVTEPAGAARGTVALLAGCVQDRWFHDVNLATIRVLARNGWRVTAPRGQACCGALPAHNGRLQVARRLAGRAAKAFAGADAVVVNAAGCSAHMASYEELERGTGLPVNDLMVFLHEEGLSVEPGRLDARVAYHDACHALRSLGIRSQPRELLKRISGLEVVDIPDGETCCGAAGIYNVTQPGFADALGRAKAEAVIATGADTVASANPGCTMQIAASLRQLGQYIPVVHPVQLLDRAYSSKG